MAQLGVAGGGAAIGAIAGSFIPGVGTMLGAQIGWAIGGVAGALLFPPKGPNIEGPRLNDLSVQTSGYGVPIPVVAGRTKLAGNVIWKTEIEERKTTRRQGKGGGGPKITEYSYYLSWAVGLCEWLMPAANPGVLKIWLDNKLVYDTTGASEIVAIPGLTWRFYPGDESQLPDPLIEATVGANNAPAHRGLAYIVFEDVPLDKFGNRMPNVTIELADEVVQTFPQVSTIPPASPLWASRPSGRTYLGEWACNVAVDHRRGRIYEARSRTTGATGSANDEMIRVYDLVTMQTIGEYPMGDMVEHLFPLGVTPTAVSVGAAHMHLGVDGYLYCCGGGGAGAGTPNKFPLWKIDPDSWRAVGVFGPVSGGGLGFGDYGTSVVMPMQITSISVPQLMLPPRTLVVIQGTWSSTLVIDGDEMTYLWGAGDLATTPPPIPIGLGISPLSYPMLLVRGKESEKGGDLWVLRGSDTATPLRVDVTRFRFNAAATNLGGGVAMGIDRDDYTAVDIQAGIDPSASRIVMQAAYWDDIDETLVMTISGSGSPGGGWGRFSTFKLDPGTGTIAWSVVDHAAPAAHDGRGSMGRVLGGTWGLGGNFVVQPGAGSELVNAAGDDFNNLFWLDEQQAVVGYVSSGIGAREVAKRYLTRAAPATLTVGQVVQALCERAGLEVTDVNVSALTDTMRGYTLARPMSARDAITPLAAAWQFDAAEVDDVLLFRKRAGSVVATIGFDDLIRESPDESVIEEQRAQDLELPREVTARYADIDRGWEQGAQSWRRPLAPTATMGSQASAAIDLPMPLTAAEAKTVAQRMCIATWRERTRMSFAVGPKYMRLVPTDPIMVGTRDGASIRCRVLSTQLGSNGVTRIEAVTEDAAVYGLSVDADGGTGWAEPGMPLPYYTRLVVPDLALVLDGDDTGQAGLREYAFACAYDGARWRGVRLVRSQDAVTWGDLGTVTASVQWGSVAVMPAAPATPWTWDETGEIVVRMADGAPESATAAEVLDWANIAALVGPDGTAEIIQWRTATDEGGGVFRLTGLLRGRRGTEDQISARGAGDLFLLLDETRVPFSALASEASATRYHRAVGVYDTIGTALPTVVKTVRGRAERPYAPARITGARDGSDNLTITWTRRTRVGGEWLNGTGTVPVSEGAEAYEVDVLNGSGAVVRTITGLTTPQATYLASAQVTDFGSAQASVAVRIYQMSNIVGRGIAAEASV